MNTFTRIGFASLLLGGCVNHAVIAGDRDADPDGREGGSGLHVEGTIAGQNSVPNAARAADYETRFQLALYVDGMPATNAVVTVTSAGGRLVLVRSGGSYVGTQQGYYGTYSLAVRAGPVDMQDVSLAGPELHVFRAPPPGSTQRAGVALPIAWEPSDAPTATIESRHLPETPIMDTGTYTLPASAVFADPGQLVDDRVRVRRSAELPIPEASFDSVVKIEVRNELEFAVDGR